MPFLMYCGGQSNRCAGPTRTLGDGAMRKWSRRETSRPS